MFVFKLAGFLDILKTVLSPKLILINACDKPTIAALQLRGTSLLNALIKQAPDASAPHLFGRLPSSGSVGQMLPIERRNFNWDTQRTGQIQGKSCAQIKFKALAG